MILKNFTFNLEETALTLDSLYIGVPIGAFFCFLFIFFSFLNAGDAKPVRYFRQILLSCLIWTGGVVMMRMQIMPGMRFWFHVSVFGFLTVPIFMYAFLFYMLEIKKNGFLTGYCIATVVAMGINVVTEVFIPEPDIIRYADGSIGYACHLSWGSYLFAAAEAFMLYDENGEKILPSGHFEIFVGGMQPDSRSEKLTGKTVESLML